VERTLLVPAAAPGAMTSPVRVVVRPPAEGTAPLVRATALPPGPTDARAPWQAKRSAAAPSRFRSSRWPCRRGAGAGDRRPDFLGDLQPGARLRAPWLCGIAISSATVESGRRGLVVPARDPEHRRLRRKEPSGFTGFRNLELAHASLVVFN